VLIHFLLSSLVPGRYPRLIPLPSLFVMLDVDVAQRLAKLFCRTVRAEWRNRDREQKK
jgi:hypothetical protein